MDLEALARRMRKMRASAIRQAVDSKQTTISQARVVDPAERRRTEPARTSSIEPQTQ